MADESVGRRFARVLALSGQGEWERIANELEECPALAQAQDDRGATLLIYLAGCGGAASVLEKLVGLGADLNHVAKSGANPIAAAIEGGSSYGLTTLPELEVLLKAGAAIDRRAEAGYPPLHWAIVLNRLEHARLLLRYGASPDQRSFDDKETAIDVARRVGNEAAIKLLVGRNREEYPGSVGERRAD